jgi:hypothetical protein
MRLSTSFQIKNHHPVYIEKIAVQIQAPAAAHKMLLRFHHDVI